MGIFIAPTIPTKCCLHQILDETNVKGCENGLNIFKFIKNIVVVKKPWKRKCLFWLVSYNDWLIIDCYYWLVVVIDPCVTFAHTFNMYYPIFIVYWLGRSKHFKLNLNAIINDIAQRQCIFGSSSKEENMGGYVNMLIT